jgi:hypothetical protein
VVETAADGTQVSTLRLTLQNSKNVTAHTLNFLISRENESRQLSTGTYKISKNIDGFLNHFDGVFGFANIGILGELPFFAEQGKITVFETGKDNMRGTIDISLKNANGNQLTLRGNFLADRNKVR